MGQDSIFFSLRFTFKTRASAILTSDLAHPLPNERSILTKKGFCVQTCPFTAKFRSSPLGPRVGSKAGLSTRVVPNCAWLASFWEVPWRRRETGERDEAHSHLSAGTLPPIGLSWQELKMPCGASLEARW